MSVCVVVLTAACIMLQDPERWLSLIILGAITFIPGAYHVAIAFKAWRGDHGYSFDDISIGFEENLDTTLNFPVKS